MSQRTRRSSVEPVGRGRTATVKASGDTAPSIPHQSLRQRSRSRSKIPKSLRYGLDNALVGLCNVWFEEIKPHLIRNNIKVHAHGLGGAPASGDHRRPLPAPRCAHLDPGAASDHQRHLAASSAGCCSTQPTASRARSHRQQASLPQTRRMSPNQNHHENVDRSGLRKERRWRHSAPSPRRPQQPRKTPSPFAPTAPHMPRVTRLCRTRSFIPPPSSRPHPVPRPAKEYPRRPYYSISPKLRPKMLDKSTQTTWYLDTTNATCECQQFRRSGSIPPDYENRVTIQKKHHDIPHHIEIPRRGINQRVRRVTEQDRPVLAQPQGRQRSLHNSIPTALIARQQIPSSRQHEHTQKDARRREVARPTRLLPAQASTCIQNFDISQRRKQKKRHSAHCYSESVKQDARTRPEETSAALAPVVQNPAETTSHRRSRRQMPARNKTLFKDDLINMMADMSDKHLRVLYKSPTRCDSRSSMNLAFFQSQHCKKTKPWI